MKYRGHKPINPDGLKCTIYNKTKLLNRIKTQAGPSYLSEIFDVVCFVLPFHLYSSPFSFSF
jgi:hypothetical protein